MKKLMIACVAVAAACFAEAATVNWASGNLYVPNADGSIGSTAGGKWTWNTTKVGTSYNVKMYVWESLVAAEVSYEAGDLFAWYQDGAKSSEDPFGTSLTAINGTYDGTKSTATANGVLSGAAGVDTVSGAILFVLEDDKGNAQWYMENAASKAASTSIAKVNVLAMYQGGSTSNSVMSWQSVPEPTSAMLLLLGFAGLALRRKRA